MGLVLVVHPRLQPHQLCLCCKDTPRDILRLAQAVESLSTLKVAHTVQLMNQVETLSVQLATLSGALGLTLDELFCTNPCWENDPVPVQGAHRLGV